MTAYAERLLARSAPPAPKLAGFWYDRINQGRVEIIDHNGFDHLLFREKSGKMRSVTKSQFLERYRQ